VSRLDRLWAGWRREYIEGITSGPEPDCIFCAILQNGLADEETHVVWRHSDGRVAAILNAYPYTSGHLLVMPTAHLRDIEDLDPATASSMWEGLTQAVQAVRAAYGPDGLNLGANLGKAAGAGVPGHLHFHVLPRWAGDTNFMTSVAEARVLPESLGESAAKLRAAWPAL
jgi:ATP adenylyltransferase